MIVIKEKGKKKMMIYVEIEVPILGNVYDFQLESKETIRVLLEEILSAIRRKEQCCLEAQNETFVLSYPEKAMLLHPEKRLKDYGIVTGSRLFLI